MRATETTARLLAFFPPRSASFFPQRRKSQSSPKGPRMLVRSLHQQRSQIPVALLADVHLWLALAGVRASRLQPHKTSHVATLFEAMGVFDGQDIRQRNQVSDALHLLEQFDLRIRLLAIFSIRRSYSLICSFSDSISRSNGNSPGLLGQELA